MTASMARRLRAAVRAALTAYALQRLLELPTNLGFLVPLLAVPLYCLYVRALAPAKSRASGRTGLCCGTLFTLFHIAGDYPRLMSGTLSGALALLPVWAGLWALYVGVCRLLADACDGWSAAREEPVGRREKALSFLVPFLLTLVCWGIVWLAVFPGSVVPDSLEQLRQASGESPYDQRYSVAHTFLLGLIYRPVVGLTGSETYGVAACCAVQLPLMAAICAYATQSVALSGAKRGLVVASALFFALMPYHAFFSVTLLKDVPFSGSVLLLTAALWRVSRRARAEGALRWRGNRLDLLLTFVAGVLMCLLRPNGLPTYAAFCALVAALALIQKRGRLALVPLLSALALAACVQYGLYPALQIKGGDEIDYLYAPFQQMARVVVDAQPLTTEETAALDAFMRVERVPEVYEGVLSDPVRDLVRETCGAEYLRAHTDEFWALWRALGAKYPQSYLRAQLDLTSGYFFPRAFYVYTDRIAVSYGDLANYPKLPAWAVNAVKGWGRLFCETGAWRMLWMIAAPVWALLFLVIRGAFRRDGRLLLLCAPVLIIWLSLLVSTPLSGEFRYLYALFLGLPVSFAAAFEGGGAQRL